MYSNHALAANEAPANPPVAPGSRTAFANQIDLVHKAEINIRTYTHSNRTQTAFANRPPLYGLPISQGCARVDPKLPLIDVQGSPVPDWDLLMRQEANADLQSRLRPFNPLPPPLVLSRSKERSRRRRNNFDAEKQHSPKRTAQQFPQQPPPPYSPRRQAPEGHVSATKFPLVRPATPDTHQSIFTPEQFEEVNLFLPETPTPAAGRDVVLEEVFPTREQLNTANNFSASPAPASPVNSRLRAPVKRERSVLGVAGEKRLPSGLASGGLHRRRRSSISGPAVLEHMPTARDEEAATVVEEDEGMGELLEELSRYGLRLPGKFEIW